MTKDKITILNTQRPCKHWASEQVCALQDGACPLCMGTGTLTPDQKAHWEEFARAHSVVECSDCHERHLVCERGKGRPSVLSRKRR